MPHDPDNHHFQNIAGFGVKKSDFNDQGATAFEGTATIDVVINGVNKKQSIANFFANAGTTLLSPVGGAGAIPVLEQFIGAANVRGIESGPGILASISNDDGIEIRENLIADATGIPILRKQVDDSTIRSLVSGAGIDLTFSGSAITIAATGQTPPSTKTKVILQESDFPDPEFGVIRLEDNTDYFIANDITTNNRFLTGNFSQIRSVGAKCITLTYLGTDQMFEASDTTCAFHRISLVCSSGTFIHFENTDDEENTSSLIITECDIYCSEAGSFTDGHTFLMAEVNFPQEMDFGFGIFGFCIRMSITEIEVNLESETFLSMVNSSFDSIQIENNYIIIQGSSIFLDGDFDDENLHTDGQGTVSGNIFFGSGTPLVGVSPNDEQWLFSGNNRIRDTNRNIVLSFQDSALETAIVALDAPVKVNAVWTEDHANGFDESQNGRIRYNLDNDITAKITVSVSALLEGANGDRDCTFYLAISPIGNVQVVHVVPNTGIPITLNDAEIRTAVLVWEQVIPQNTRLELWVEQNDGALRNIIVQASVFRVTE